jgi:4-carboxymuconolactone decarboxylase
MEQVEVLLRRLALNDENAVRAVLSPGSESPRVTTLDPKTHALVRLGALLAGGAETTSLRWMSDIAYEAGATDDEIVGVLVAIGPTVGLAEIVRQAPRLALAIGYDLEDRAG